jgi:hypothetical protein
VRGVLEEGLAAIGFHDDAIAATWEELCRLAAAPDADDLAVRSMSELLQQRPRLGGEARVSADGPSEPRMFDLDPAPTPELAAAVERIRQLAFGTWLEFAQTPPAAPVRRRLCWFSGETGRAVLLSPRGGKGDERSLVQLANDLAHGRLRVMSDEHSHPIDRAWREVMALHRGGHVRGTAGSVP